jgi:hypothetical protein
MTIILGEEEMFSLQNHTVLEISAFCGQLFALLCIGKEHVYYEISIWTNIGGLRRIKKLLIDANSLKSCNEIDGGRSERSYHIEWNILGDRIALLISGAVIILSLTWFTDDGKELMTLEALKFMTFTDDRVNVVEADGKLLKIAFITKLTYSHRKFQALTLIDNCRFLLIRSNGKELIKFSWEGDIVGYYDTSCDSSESISISHQPQVLPYRQHVPLKKFESDNSFKSTANDIPASRIILLWCDKLRILVNAEKSRNCMVMEKLVRDDGLLLTQQIDLPVIDACQVSPNKKSSLRDEVLEKTSTQMLNILLVEDSDCCGTNAFLTWVIASTFVFEKCSTQSSNMVYTEKVSLIGIRFKEIRGVKNLRPSARDDSYSTNGRDDDKHFFIKNVNQLEVTLLDVRLLSTRVTARVNDDQLNPATADLNLIRLPNKKILIVLYVDSIFIRPLDSISSELLVVPLLSSLYTSIVPKLFRDDSGNSFGTVDASCKTIRLNCRMTLVSGQFILTSSLHSPTYDGNGLPLSSNIDRPWLNEPISTRLMSLSFLESLETAFQCNSTTAFLDSSTLPVISLLVVSPQFCQQSSLHQLCMKNTTQSDVDEEDVEDVAKIYNLERVRSTSSSIRKLFRRLSLPSRLNDDLMKCLLSQNRSNTFSVRYGELIRQCSQHLLVARSGQQLNSCSTAGYMAVCVGSRPLLPVNHNPGTHHDGSIVNSVGPSLWLYNSNTNRWRATYLDIPSRVEESNKSFGAIFIFVESASEETLLKTKAVSLDAEIFGRCDKERLGK